MMSRFPEARPSRVVISRFPEAKPGRGMISRSPKARPGRGVISRSPEARPGRGVISRFPEARPSRVGISRSPEARPCTKLCSACAFHPDEILDLSTLQYSKLLSSTQQQVERRESCFMTSWFVQPTPGCGTRRIKAFC